MYLGHDYGDTDLKGMALASGMLCHNMVEGEKATASQQDRAK